MKINHFKKQIVPLIVLILMLAGNLLAVSRAIMRFPDIHENLVAFVYGDDIWTVPASGGIATRITTNDGAERYPRFSPDGQLIAFSGEYDGNADVYVMNIHGGDIKRLTFHPDADVVVGWHPIKNKILFRSGRSSFSRFDKLFLINPDGSGLEELPLPEAAQGSFSPDGAKLAYNQVTREHRTWKRYRGGLAQEIYIYDFASQMEENISNFAGTDRLPMWVGDKIYFASDRDRVLNLYAYDMKTRKTEQITRHQDYDVRRPEIGGNQIVYELGGTLWVLDVATAKTHQIPVEIETDAPEARPYLAEVNDLISGFDCSPCGKQTVINARGEIFSVPVKKGSTKNLTQTSGAREKDVAWSPDGEKIAFFSDESGEYEIYVRDANGKQAPVKLTTHKNGHRHTLRWSPDSKKLAFTDQTLRCYILDVATRKNTEVDRAEFENIDVALDLKPIYDFHWSPDSRFLAYSKMNTDLVTQIYIYELETGKRHCASNGLFNDFWPVFSTDGKHLFFISNRRFDPTLCDFEWEMVYKKVAGIYCLTLEKNGTPLFPLVEKDSKKEIAKSGEVQVVIDFAGLADRIEMLPVDSGNYRYLAATGTDLFYLNKDEGDFNRFEFRKIGPMDLYAFNFEDEEERSVVKSIDDYKISANGEKIIFQKKKEIGVIDTKGGNSKEEMLSFDLKMWLNPREEWQQIFNEAWRMERDFFYDPNMHGHDWKAMREKYGQLVPSASCRGDVTYLIGELIGELNTSHTYVYGGDFKREAENVNVGLLGVDWGVEPASQRYFFKKICRVPDWSRKVLPPLAQPGLNVPDGTFLLQVNGTDVTTAKNIYSYFQDLGNETVTLLINEKPDLKGAREITVKTVTTERWLRYHDWVEHNRQLVAEKSGGQIGYLHFPDTYLGTATEFPKYFYSQTRKQGLIIDGRFNGGGLDPGIFLQRLEKQIVSYWTRRYSHDQTSPSTATRAHLVLLTNRQAGSGGDELPYEFQRLKMGPVIGTRTWGGLVGISMFIELIDGGGVTVPDYRIYTPEGKWVVENEGVTPDIEVPLKPAEVARGDDAQLMKGLEVLLEKIKTEPRPWPQHDPIPIDQ